MSRQATEVAEYFYSVAEGFDSIYTGRKGRFEQWIDCRFRQDIFERFRLTLEFCGNVTGKEILDIGCGSGRYAVEFSRRGATNVLGVDLAASMINLAKELAAQNGVSDICEFVQADFMTWQPAKQYDYSIAIGVLDYVAEPQHFLELMLSRTRCLGVVSFPSKCWWRFRKLRYRLKNCPLWLYDQPGVQNVLAQVPHQRHEIRKIPGQGYDFVVSIIP